MKRTAPLVLVATLITACSDGGDVAGTPTSSTAAEPAAPTPSETASAPAADPTATDAGSSVPRSAPTTAAPASTVPDPVAATSTTATIPVVPETGVPGLDSDDAFCAAWSRFGGSWQVLAVGSSFLGDPQRVAEWEIVAAHVIGDSYAELVTHLPDELAEEAGPVADGYFGVLDRRAAAARESLVAAGAEPAAIDDLGAAWIAALAARDPARPDLELELPDELVPIVERAAADLRARRVPFHEDPSMVVEAETPLTDTYLESTCPDQGTLSGQEVDPG